MAAGFAEFLDPHPVDGNQFGAAVVPLSTGNVVITSPYDDAGGTDAGTVYLFNGRTGQLISTLTGSHANDHVAIGGVTALTNGNFVIASPDWDRDTTQDVGAATWGDGKTGITGVVSADNSLVGSTPGDSPGFVLPLANGNYVVDWDHWDNGNLKDAGAVTFGSGATGVSGVVSAENSLVGGTAFDGIGSGNIKTLSNGNYVVGSPNWTNGSLLQAGAVTFGDGTVGIHGLVTTANSLVGSQPNDQLGSGRVTALASGNYVVASPFWDNGSTADVGAVTLGNGLTGTVGQIDASSG